MRTFPSPAVSGVLPPLSRDAVPGPRQSPGAEGILRRYLPLLLSGFALLLGLVPAEAWATCYPSGATQECSKGTCQGTRTCDDYWGPCEYDGSSTTACSVCGRSGTRFCSETGNVIGTSCTAYRAQDDICNGCDDDGDGQIDEDYVPTILCDAQQNGCFGKLHCVSGQLVCKVQVGTQYLSCADDCSGYSAKRWCRENGTVGPCTRDTPTTELCNGCDDDQDGVVNNAPGQGTNTLTRECVGPGGACPGSTEACATGSWSGVCNAPPEACNGLDDDCDGTIDESNICRSDLGSCSCTPTSCAAQGRNCGSIPDGCGGTLSCGACGAGQICNNNVCVGACAPRTCAQQAVDCGVITDTCGGTLDCGPCGMSQGG
ncbi:hypothetical protein HUA78_35685 [Myxococcus sp. CA033]|uniref:hypothetical protein n=1 Tax=Myxococcus sp. CA033 TaxID=2741516 RepID=UPI001C2D042A|nr:hypothetical protein [Myxococcus sp. CA033]NTX39793.1 hypothetical protein [Myxococcus sp. CA033]